MHIFLLSVFLFISNAMATLDCKTEIFYELEDKKILMCIDQSDQYVFSKTCLKGPKICKEIEKIKKTLKDKAVLLFDYGGDPIIYLCDELKGANVLGRSPEGGTSSFCLYNGHYFSENILIHAAQGDLK